MVSLLKGFKVIKTIDRSSCCPPNKESLMIYPTREKVQRKPGYGPLAVFDIEYAAHSFVISIGKEDLWSVKECIYRRSGRNILYTPCIVSGPFSLPYGTDFADWVICLE